MAEHIRSTKNLQDCLVLFSSRAQNSLDPELWRSGDVETVQQIPQFTDGDRGSISCGLDLVGIAVRLVLLGIAQRSVVFIIFTFNLVAIFFFFLVVFFFLLMIIIVVIIPQQLLSFLRVFSHRYRDHSLEGVLPLRNVLRSVSCGSGGGGTSIGTN
jgi:hypothetical protein